MSLAAREFLLFLCDHSQVSLAAREFFFFFVTTHRCHWQLVSFSFSLRPLTVVTGSSWVFFFFATTYCRIVGTRARPFHLTYMGSTLIWKSSVSWKRGYLSFWNWTTGSTAHCHGNIGKNDDKSVTSCMTSGRCNSKKGVYKAHKSSSMNSKRRKGEEYYASN